MKFAKRPSLLRRRSFSNSTADVHASIPEVLEDMVSINTLTIGYTKDIELAEKAARATGVRRLSIQNLSRRPFAELERGGANKMVRPALMAGREDGIYNSDHGYDEGQGSAEGGKILE